VCNDAENQRSPTCFWSRIARSFRATTDSLRSRAHHGFISFRDWHTCWGQEEDSTQSGVVSVDIEQASQIAISRGGFACQLAE
jgi:hypothetical protein